MVPFFGLLFKKNLPPTAACLFANIYYCTINKLFVYCTVVNISVFQLSVH